MSLVADPPAETTRAVKVARSFEELEQLRPAWESFSMHRVDADPDFFTAYAETSPAVVRPHVIELDHGGEPAGLVVGRLEDTVLRAMVGYKAVYRPRVRLLTVAHGGITGAGSPGLAHESVEQLLAALRANEADAALLPGVRTDSPLFEAARTLPPSLCRQRPLSRNTHWKLVLPESMEAFTASLSKRTRQNTRQYANKLQKEFGDRLTLETLSASGDADRIFADLGEISAKTYQGGLGVGFEDTPARRRITTLGLERGWFRAYVLYVDGSPVAFWPGYAYNRTFFTGTPGYDPALAEFRLGTYLLLRVIEDLCTDPAVDEVDYGFGDADYKRRFGTESWEEADVLVFAPRFKGIRVNLVRTAIVGSAQAARAAVDTIGLTAALKKRWRKRLSR